MNQNTIRSPLEKVALASAIGFAGSFAFYYVNTKYGLTDNISLTPTQYNWTVGGIPEMMTGLLGTSTTGLIYEKFLKAKTKIKTIFPTLIAASAITLAGAADEMHNFSGGTSDEMDIVKYALGASVAVGASLFSSKKK